MSPVLPCTHCREPLAFPDPLPSDATCPRCGQPQYALADGKTGRYWKPTKVGGFG